MRTSDFDYFLPHEFIAQEPQAKRDACKLLVLDRKMGKTAHRKFFEITAILRAGDVLVLNNTKVFRSRLKGHLQGNTKSGVEIFLLKPMSMGADACVWEALGKPGHKLKEGVVVEFQEGIKSVVCKAAHDGGVMEVRFDCAYGELMTALERIGHIPVPPYIKKEPRTLEEYQTVYASDTGSVAAPTAGFHFTSELLGKIRAQGVQIVEITLHVGIGTFRPVKTDVVEDHVMHGEFVSVGEYAARVISAAKKEGRRVIAAGTTVVRALEGVYATQQAGIEVRALRRLTERGGASFLKFSGEVNIFITPGFEFHIVDALITNFHLPKSTLLMLVSAFAGRERVLAAYEEAKKHGYKFFSFGDAMFIH
ncbi:MAG: S-adenosylmethionine:tRNA ribosyltransferase-isomerase [Candidatus Magasanikbacteria bacterium GW2011_GWA2_45_39]|uniref:S-adenosylmethionine:tRNA ribosyltransferase-isomerase n=2 Tax=Candidatus Magasanikiibacteriota TaxID=1752731 RepID=A0A0G1MWK0_9BACT|nr:MAG: S-adenosylmethionine:tRNA ribosyltransferase-isomerase [Candidatus Magasanikbacteria bacterium GW2011_GWA2_45_39]KKU12572.1 MAG: S-adenosylmethionine:tRNA ribosyltransferase-isomerase [Candidatus Magasanikbacteria bacterium GW2011_GWC2_45_8]HBW74365.1 tRNA preQ1(34) S-adenosylmethionine ribosyltransferase-isomerase QueA [Candidatus Magasanikbacteria bacterium]